MKKSYFIWLMAILLLTACAGKDAESAEPKKNVATEEVAKEDEEETGGRTESKEYVPKEVEYYEIENLGRELSELENEMLRYPGIYSGDDYDEVKVNEAIDQLPDDLTAEQYFDELKYLLTEDYHEELETLLRFDPNVEVDIARPDETVENPGIKTAHYAILIDASGSMKAMVGNKNRMDAAKEAVFEFAEQIPENATISMRVYGHKGSGSDADQELSCTSTENFYNGNFDNGKFKKALDKIKPAGWTPIGLALETVKEDIPENTDDVIVYVVSDGIETCGGDPVKAAEDLVSADIETVVNIIGFDVDNEGQKLLKEVATAGNGEFTYVDSEQDLKKYLKAQYEEIQKAWQEWKRAGQKQAHELKEEKKKLANETKESMKKKSNQEKERMKQASQYLKSRLEETENSSIGNDLYFKSIDYSGAKYWFAIDIGSDAYWESINSGNEKYWEFVEEGNEKITETIKKKNEQ
ncbi:D-amino-acid dehydrogenase/Ca-activated chloride channel family protein [Lederbergia galactosidilyticus]|uniref:VWA domain-containing protein n=1 Tax=Lederbergia galactosidilytica TaxID=217031 RepID=UPI0007171210|nr:D-amino-acid dehydrogenase/Ca-activated chloride channel family protein [Lederbergia galactosidilytica]